MKMVTNFGIFTTYGDPSDAFARFALVVWDLTSDLLVSWVMVACGLWSVVFGLWSLVFGLWCAEVKYCL
jgi:hypothetical protein